MKLKTIYSNKEDIPEGFEGLFTENRDGKWELTEISGLKTQADIDRIQGALDKERNDHKETKAELKKFDGIDPDKVHEDQDELEQLRALKEAGGMKGGTEEFDRAVNAAVQREVGKVKRERDQAIIERDEARTENEKLSGKITTGTIKEAVGKAASTAGVVDSAREDILMLGERLFEVTTDGRVMTKDGVGVTPGLEPDVWLEDMKDKRPHWWPTSQGAGVRGGKDGEVNMDSNPWTRRGWNLTEQGKIYEKDPSKAEQLAKAAGHKSPLGAMRPAK